MAFLRAVLNWDRAVLFLGDAADKKRGRATWVFDVDNIPGMHGVKRPITSTTSSTLKWIAGQKNLSKVATSIKASVRTITKSEDHFVISYEIRSEKKDLRARFVILATGVMDIQPEIKGSIEPVFPFANRSTPAFAVSVDGGECVQRTVPSDASSMMPFLPDDR